MINFSHITYLEHITSSLTVYHLTVYLYILTPLPKIPGSATVDQRHIRIGEYYLEGIDLIYVEDNS